jgi:hypothetical protein
VPEVVLYTYKPKKNPNTIATKIKMVSLFPLVIQKALLKRVPKIGKKYPFLKSFVLRWTLYFVNHLHSLLNYSFILRA